VIGFPILGQSLAIELSNTLFARNGAEVDGLSTTDGVQEWIEALGERLHDPPRPTEPLRRALVGLRSDIRSILSATVGGVAPPRSAVRAVSASSEQAPVWLELTWQGGAATATTRRQGPPGQGLCAQIADSLTLLVTGDDAPRLRACPAPGCLGFFLQDHGRREFCSTSCATRARVARHYQRHHRQATGR
jgi:predicted RNA-binding Zn ribbon-like protein